MPAKMDICEEKLRESLVTLYLLSKIKHSFCKNSSPLQAQFIPSLRASGRTSKEDIGILSFAAPVTSKVDFNL